MKAKNKLSKNLFLCDVGHDASLSFLVPHFFSFLAAITRKNSKICLLSKEIVATTRKIRNFITMSGTLNLIHILWMWTPQS